MYALLVASSHSKNQYPIIERYSIKLLYLCIECIPIQLLYLHSEGTSVNYCTSLLKVTRWTIEGTPVTSGTSSLKVHHWKSVPQLRLNQFFATYPAIRLKYFLVYHLVIPYIVCLHPEHAQVTFSVFLQWCHTWKHLTSYCKQAVTQLPNHASCFSLNLYQYCRYSA